MSLLSRINERFGNSTGWMQAEGVLPVERAIADEHEAMHGAGITAELEKITLEFDATQFTDIPALARDFRNALGARESAASGVHGQGLRGLLPVRSVRPDAGSPDGGSTGVAIRQ